MLLLAYKNWCGLIAAFDASFIPIKLVRLNCHGFQAVDCIKDSSIGFSQNPSKACAFRNPYFGLWIVFVFWLKPVVYYSLSTALRPWQLRLNYSIRLTTTSFNPVKLVNPAYSLLKLAAGYCSARADNPVK